MTARFGFDIESRDTTPPLSRQVHGAGILTIRSAEHCDELLRQPPEADALVTFEPNVRLYVFTADCLPVLIYPMDRGGPVAAIHAGWRGAKGNIVTETLKSIGGNRVHVVLGPAILRCCFEVKEDFLLSFKEAGQDPDRFVERRKGRSYFDLPEFVLSTQLAGIPPERIHRSYMRCTYCSAPPLPSYRRNGSTDPRLKSWILLEEPQVEVDPIDGAPL